MKRAELCLSGFRALGRLLFGVERLLHFFFGFFAVKGFTAGIVVIETLSRPREIIVTVTTYRLLFVVVILEVWVLV